MYRKNIKSLEQGLEFLQGLKAQLDSTTDSITTANSIQRYGLLVPIVFGDDEHAEVGRAHFEILRSKQKTAVEEAINTVTQIRDELLQCGDMYKAHLTYIGEAK